MLRFINKTALLSFAVLIMLGVPFSGNSSAAANTSNLDSLYIEIGDALMKAKQSDWNAVKQNLELFKNQWNDVKADGSVTAETIDKKMKKLDTTINESNKDPEEIRELLSSVSKGLAAYDKEQHPVDDQKEKKKLNQLLPMIDEIETEVESGDYVAADTKHQQFLVKWTANESIVRKQSVVSYGEIETQMAYLRIALSQEPPDQQKALSSIKDLRTSLENFLSGKNVKKAINDDHTVDDVIDLLDKSSNAIAAGKTDAASEHLNQILIIWPAIEGEVRTKDHNLYNRMENDVPAVLSLLNSEDKDLKQSEKMVDDLKDGLEGVASKTSYSFIDAFLILFREGLEALLIISGLIAFLKKTNHADKQVWIWNGVVSGVIASAILAVCIHIFFSNVSAATSREFLEGIVGIFAVVMMLTVGAWLHKKSNINQWNQFINDNLGRALAKGSLISMTALSFLSIFREGAETIIFYAGMAPSIEISQLIIGIVIAAVVLIILGFVIIRYSTIIPLRPFFIVAATLIYVLSFKMLGVSIHALQVANTLPVHSLKNIPYIDFIGFFPTLETIIPQLVLLVMIIGTTLYVKRASGRKTMKPITQIIK